MISTAEQILVCPVDDLPPGQMRRVEVAGGAPITVYNVEGDLFATADTCTHAEASLAEGDLDGDEVICPVHWASFNVRTGQPLCFPATLALARYAVEIVDGQVLVRTKEIAA